MQTDRQATLTEAYLAQEVVRESLINLKNGDRICIITHVVIRSSISILTLDILLNANLRRWVTIVIVWAVNQVSWDVAQLCRCVRSGHHIFVDLLC